MEKIYQTGFALSGGFIKGLAHLGAIQALFEHNIRPDIISGVSAGALAGAFLADGYEPYEILQFFANASFFRFTKPTRAPGGLLRLDECIDFMRSKLSVRNIEELRIPFSCTATDLDHGRSVSFRKGAIAERVAASCSMPIVFAPIKIEGTYYVDGGVLMNLPVSTIRHECRQVIAINVSPIHAEEKYRLNIMGVAMRTYNFMSHANIFKDIAECDLLIEPQGLDKYANTDLDKAEEIFTCGYDTACRVLFENKR